MAIIIYKSTYVNNVYSIEKTKPRLKMIEFLKQPLKEDIIPNTHFVYTLK